MVQIRTDAKTERYQFDSTAEMARWVQDTPATWSTRNSEKEGRSKSWDLGCGYAQAVEMMRYGWQEGAEKAQKALKALPPVTFATMNKNDFYGHRPNVARFCAGAPDCMIRHAPSDTGSGAVLTLLVPINAPAMTTANAMANFGIGLAQYINQLETNGTRVEVWALSVSDVGSGYGRSKRVVQSWRVKRADPPLDLAFLCFSVGHPASFRRIGFALLERCGVPEDYTYGCTVEAKASDMIHAPNGAIVLNGMKYANDYASTPEAALEYVTKTIEEAQQKGRE